MNDNNLYEYSIVEGSNVRVQLKSLSQMQNRIQVTGEGGQEWDTKMEFDSDFEVIELYIPKPSGESLSLKVQGSGGYGIRVIDSDETVVLY